MWIKRRHRIVTGFLKIIFPPYLKLKYKFTRDKRISIGKGSIVLSNHTTTLDPFLVQLLFKEHLYFMASKDLFNHRFTGKLIKWLINPIPKEKSKKNDISAVKNCMRVIKEGGNVCIFPEGNRTFSGKLGNVDYSIVKLVKSLKVPLVILNIQGGYPTDPRWGNTVRKGRVHVGFKKIYSYEEIKDMDNDELYKLIVENLKVDDYNYYPEYKGKNLAEDLERIFYICPICGKMHTIYSKNDIIYCKKCGLEVIYRKNLTFAPNKEEFTFFNVGEWYEWQVEKIKEMVFEDDELIYNDAIELYLSIPFKSKQLLIDGTMKMYGSYFEFENQDKKIKINFDEVEAITMVGKKKMNIYVGDKTYQVFKTSKTNLLKYLHMFYVIKNKKMGGNYAFLGI